MKRENLLQSTKSVYLFLTFSLLCTLTTLSQPDTWQQKSSIPASIRYLATGFSIGSKGYIGTGFDGTNILQDIWEFDPVTDTWSQKANMPDSRAAAVSFTIGNKGYVCTGSADDLGAISRNDLWEFDPAMNTWTRKADFPGIARQVATAFSIGNKGYVGVGRSASFELYQDFWEYDPLNDSWTRKADYPGGPTYAAVGFGLANKGYIGTGVGYPLYTFKNDFWEYNPATDAWTQKANFGGTARELAVGFSIGYKGYIGTGGGTSDLWEYNPLTNTWTQKANFPGGGRNMATGFAVNGKGYLGTGAIFYLQNDLWEYTPSIAIYYADNDNDGYGNPANSIEASSAPSGYVSDNTDCNDNNASSYPGAHETQNSIDDNCDGQVDEGLIGFNQFVFLKGNTTDYRYGAPGVQGVASVSNNPGIRRFQTTWEYNGKMYLYGGEGVGAQQFPPAGNPTPPQGYLSDLWEYNPATNLWKWIKGNSTLGGAAVYGTKGVAAATNTPGARKNSLSWVLNNKLYLFGGYAGGRLSDLWEYNPATNNWTWISGNNSFNSLGVFGTMGVPDVANLPSGREQAATWTYNGKLYLFGGLRSDGVNDVILNDQWEYDFNTGFWTWVKGTNLTNQFGVYGTKGVSSPTNIPGSKYEAAFSSIGNKFYLFGGSGASASAYGVMNDLWEFDNTTGNWTWIHGSSGTDVLKVTGTQGTYTAANTPGSRSSVTMSAHNNTLYLYGGLTWFLGFHSDLWQYDPSLNQWRSVKGNTGTGTLGNYGFQTVEAATNLPGARGQNSFVTVNNKLILFGGRGFNGVSSTNDESRNDLWSFNTTTNNWIWMNGSSGKERFGEYGTQGLASATNKPGDRVGHAMAALNNKVYMFGGDAKRTYNNEGGSNDLWEFDPITNNWKFLKGSTAGTLPESYGTQGVSSLSNLPGAGFRSTLWGLNNKIYMFGGHRNGYKNDLWVYDPATNNWTWIKGPNTANQPGVYGTKGVAAPANVPGARLAASGFAYNNKLYLYGGEGYNSGGTTGYLNDLWEYDPATNNWTWIAGDDAINTLGVFGTIGVAAATNKPGARINPNTEIIGNKMYLFGNFGYGNTGGAKLMNDLWQYDFTTGLWTWIKGSNTGAASGSTGTFGVEAATNMPAPRDGSTSYVLGGKLYIFGGTPFSNNFNDLWEYNPASNNWRWIKGVGNISNRRGSYGLTGIVANTNVPTDRKWMPVAIIGNTAYFFGGAGMYDNNTGENFNNLGDTWKWVGGTLGVYNKLYVNDNSLTGDVFTTAIGNNANPGTPSAPLATLDYAVTFAQPGDTIYVDAGTYVTPNLSITKPVTILGSNYNTSPNNPSDRLVINPVRNTNSMITGSTFTIASNDVRLEGLAFNPGAKSQVNMANTGINNFSFKRNYSIVTSTLFLNLNGPSSIPFGQASVFGNHLVDDNRFESHVTTNSLCITIGALNDVTINNNSFFTPAISSPRLLTSCNPGFGGLTVNFIYSNNISNSARNEVFSAGTIASARIENNISLHGQRAFVIQINNATSSGIQVRNNYIESNFAEISPIQYSRSGTASPGAVANLIIENNTIIQNSTGRTSVPASILAQTFFNGGNASTTIRRNKISFNGDYGSFTSSSVFGVSFQGNWQNINVEENEIEFNGVNLTNVIPATGQSSSGISISSDNGSFTIPANSIVNIAGNKINGFRNSFAVYDASNVAPNTFVGYGNLPAGVNVTINNNSLTNAVIAINNGTTSQTITANCNWYGSAAAQNVIAKITPSTVNHIPWLTDGTDTDLSAVGFQLVGGVCNGTPVVITLDEANDISCYGANDGSINISVSAGAAPYTYAWTKDEDPLFNSTNEDLTNLPPGTYHLTVTDANGSTETIEVTINEPELLEAFTDGTHNSCFGASEGTAFATSFGGTAPYTYLWNTGATTEDISGLAAGTYSVTVTDANGCTAVAQFEVTEPTQIIPVITNTSTACTNSATVNVTGGTGNYSYYWSNGATGTSISNVQAGEYSVEVTDENGCTATAQITLVANEGFNPSASVTEVNCFGGDDGTITITNVNGTAPFQYSIDGGFNYQSSNVFANLAAGTYTITVVDANGCTGFVTKTVTQPTELLVVLNIVQSTCFSQSTGSVNVSVSGGSPSYTYNWSGPGSFTSSQLNISNLTAGEYVLTITDNKGCIKTLDAVVTAFPQILFTSSVTNIACKGTLTGSINLTLSGGTGSGFIYQWSNGATTEDISNLGTGNYNVTVTDIGSGCTVNGNYTITQPATTVNISTSKTNATGCNSLGTITATGSGGTPSYQYSIDGINYQSSQIFTGLYAGSYAVWVKDANGCTKSVVVSITDNGSDQFESNNSKNQAKTITIGTDTFARLALATDVADWFRFTPTVGGSYTVTINHPSVSYTFNVYPAGNNAPALAPVSTTASSKEYVLSGATTYYLSVTTTTLSYICYRISIANTSPLITSAVKIKENKKPVTETVNSLVASVFPNPHKGRFNIVIDSPEEGNGIIQMMSSDGKLISSRNIVLRIGKGNIVEYNNMNQEILFYRVIINQKSVTGKIIGPN